MLMVGVQIDGDALTRLCRERRLTGIALGVLAKVTPRHVYRLTSGRQPASLELLDRLVPCFGRESVAKLIVDDEQRAVFLAAHDARSE